MLVNNAAHDERHKLEDVTPEFWDDRIAVNLRHAFFAIQAVVPGMKKAGGGSIVNFSSISYHTMTANLSVYQAAKAATIGMTRGLARDLGGDKIRLNSITPGWIMTQRQIDLWLTPEAEADLMKAQVPEGEGLSARHRPHGAVPGVRRQPADLGAELRGRWRTDVSTTVASWPAKAGRLWLREMRHLLPPTIYFFCAFNVIVLTTNLLARTYWFALSTFLTATLLALLVGKAVLVANKFRADRPLPRRAADQADPVQDGVLQPGRAAVPHRRAARPFLLRQRRLPRRRSTKPSRRSPGAASRRSRSGCSPAS